MKVFIVTESFWGNDREYQAVFSTLQKAEEWKRRRCKQFNSNESDVYIIEEEVDGDEYKPEKTC